MVERQAFPFEIGSLFRGKLLVFTWEYHINWCMISEASPVLTFRMVTFLLLGSQAMVMRRPPGAGSLAHGTSHCLEGTPWKINGWNLKITCLKSGKSSGPNLHDFGCNMLIFQGVFPKYHFQHLTLDLWGVKEMRNNLACKRKALFKDVFFVNDDSTHGNWTCLPERGDGRNLLFSLYFFTIFSVFPMFCHDKKRATLTMEI